MEKLRAHIWLVFLCLHILSKRCHFFLNFGPFFEQFLGTVVKNLFFVVYVVLLIGSLKCFSNCEEVGFTPLGMPDNFENQCRFFQTLFTVATSSLLTKYV